MRLQTLSILFTILAFAGCQQLLGIDDPSARDGGGGTPDAGTATDAPSGAQHTVGGSVAGLGIGQEVSLTLNDGTPLPGLGNGSFVFPETVGEGDSYDVAVSSKPSNLDCTPSNNSGTISGADVTNVGVICAPSQRTVGVTVTGLAGGDQIDLRLNAVSPLTVTTNNVLSTFPDTLVDGQLYLVSIESQPSHLDCTLNGNSGTVNGADIADVTVVCVDAQRTIGGSISGLGAAEQVQLTLNGTDTRTLTTNGSFAFSSTLIDGNSYSVTLTSQSATLNCTLSNPSGTVSGANVDNIIVDCDPNSFVVGGSATGLVAGDQVQVTLNATEVLAITGNGAFVFTTPFANGAAYAVSITSVPATLVCQLSNGSGTVNAADVGNITVTCVPATFSVGGNVSGLGAGDQIDLTLNGSETITRSSNGAFAFPIERQSGVFYSVAVTSQPQTLTCSVTNGSGTIGVADVNNILVACVPSAILTDLSVSTLATLSPAFDPGTLNYSLSLSVLVQELVLTPTAADPNATILVDGVSVVSGNAAAPVLLDLGNNVITVQVTAQSGATQNYSIQVNRGGDIVQQIAYGKASNPEAGDILGFQIALSGDTLAVGATDEDSNDIGVNGNQVDNQAAQSGAVYVFRRTGTTWAQEAYLKASNTDGGNDRFGSALALDGDTLAVGAPLEDSNDIGVNSNQFDNQAIDSGAVYVFRRTGTTWAQEVYVKSSNSETGDHFGVSVSLNGDTLAVSAFFESSNATGVNGNQANNTATSSGAVYVFRRTGTTWAQEAYLKASNSELGDIFGISLALSGDTIAVGATSESSNATGVGGNQADNTAFLSGAVYVFRRTGTTWSQEAYVKASNTETEDQFGMLVALSGDTLAVGAPLEDSNATGVNGSQASNSAVDSGAVYVFRRTGTTWSQEAYVKASNTGAGDQFGRWVALSGDTLAVMSSLEDSNATGVNGNQADNSAIDSGAVYVFRRGGSTWAQEAYVKASNTGAGDQFGLSIALSGDTLAVGSRGEDSNATGVNGNQADNSAIESGAFYLFQ